MRLFLYNYDVKGNWEITRDREVFGVPHDNTGILTKAEKLCPGDIVLIHDSTFKTDFRLHGACVIDGPMIVQSVPEDNSPWENLLWCDEISRNLRIYHFRFRVDITGAPRIEHKRFPWELLDRVPAIGTKGQRIRGKNAWSKKWRGNLLVAEPEVAAMCELLGLKW